MWSKCRMQNSECGMRLLRGSCSIPTKQTRDLPQARACAMNCNLTVAWIDTVCHELRGSRELPLAYGNLSLRLASQATSLVRWRLCCNSIHGVSQFMERSENSWCDSIDSFHIEEPKFSVLSNRPLRSLWKSNSIFTLGTLILAFARIRISHLKLLTCQQFSIKHVKNECF